MTLDEILTNLFPKGHHVAVRPDKLILGTARRGNGDAIEVIGIADGEPLGVAGVLPLAEWVLRVIATGGETPILVMVDTRGQRMARRDEMLGLNEYLAHLAKCLLLASRKGHRTVGLNYGKAAAGAFLATALATDILVALPGAEPAVMDLPSMARVTKLPEEQLTAMSKTTPVFAPGLAAMSQVGAVAEIWDPSQPLDVQLEAALAAISDHDARDTMGASRGGRRLAAAVAKRIATEAAGKSLAAAS